MYKFLKSRIIMKKALLFFAAALFCSTVFCTNYYCSPSNTSATTPNNGKSIAKPWPRLDKLFSGTQTWAKTIVAGDTIFMLKGNHGNVKMTYKYASNVVFMSYPGDTATLARLNFVGASHVKIANLKISREFNISTAVPTKGDCVAMDNLSDHITIDNCWIFSAYDPSNFTEAQWIGMDNGISCAANHSLITNNHIMNVEAGASVNGVGTVFSHNLVENIADDGLRLADDSVKIEYNIVRNMYVKDDNHDDMLQSSSHSATTGGVGGGTVTACEIRGNQFIAMVLPIKYPNVVYGSTIGTTIPVHDWNGVPVEPQGIGCFDGMFKDWIVENNIIAVESAHGIAFFGAINCKILNNTLIEPPSNLNTNSYAQIELFSHKNGTPSTGNLVRGNFVKRITNLLDESTRKPNPDPTNIIDFNHVVAYPDYTKYFVDYKGYDFHLKAGAPCIGQGSADGTPTIDLDGVTRTLPYDAGCYNYAGEKTAINNVFVNTGARLSVVNSRLLIKNINGETTVRIFDAKGLIVATKTTNENSLEFKLNTKGLYLVQIQSGTIKSSLKIVL